MAHVVIIRVDPVVVETGLWCDRCALPSAARVELHQLVEDGVRLIGVVVVCTDCAHYEPG